MLIMIWNIQKSGSKNVRCVCVRVCVCAFDDTFFPVIFPKICFLNKFQFQMYRIFIYKCNDQYLDMLHQPTPTVIEGLKRS